MNDFLKYSLLTVAIAMLSIEGNAQVQNVLDAAYVRETNLTKRVIPYPHLREADVMYMRRVWQVMDLQQKINHPYYFPTVPIKDRKSLFDVIRQGLLDEGSLVAYSTGAIDDDEFTIPLLPDSVYNLLNIITIEDEYADDGLTVIGKKKVETKIKSDDITRYMLKEDWIWDRQRSERYVRIIGIAPMMEKFDENSGNSLGFTPLFWLYYPECRYVFANADVFNLFNDAQRRTYEDLFQKRYFASYIIKESNVYDRTILSYAKGRDGLAESERIKEELFLLEHDLWHY
jgi:gliding motility associated protien GldN